MALTRRSFVTSAAALPFVTGLPNNVMAAFAPKPGTWRQFETTTEIAIAQNGQSIDLWVPLPSVNEVDWMTTGDTSWSTNAASCTRETDPKSGAAFLHASWQPSDDVASLTARAAVSTRSRSTDFDHPTGAAPLSAADRALYTEATALIPTDGIVAETAQMITAGATNDLEKARRIYDWVVENTARNPETRGCGLGDIASMLSMGDLTGKCADLNALYVGLARAAGLPARDVYGLRVAPSNFGYKSLGAGSSDVTRAQHCRAEVFLEDFGWTAVDPADVRKVMLEEPPKNLALDDPKVVDARKALFGGWEGNWIGYNFAHDIALPGAQSGPAPFLMYPLAERGGELLDELAPAEFVYTITAQELSA